MAAVLFLQFGVLLLWAQHAVQTLVPQKPVAVGQAFQVQYIVHDLSGFEQLQTPDFGPHFKLVSGPAVHSGSIVKGGKNIAVQNFSFTLVPLRKGQLIVNGALALYQHKKEMALPAFVTSTDAAPPAGMVSGFPPQRTDAITPATIIGQLLVKAEAEKKECYVGEPITATFTLLSKVATVSEVIKNPGFYGFSVVEMPPDARQMDGAYTGGYEKHLLRKVQLYPMQAGRLVIDEMTVYNMVQWIDADGMHREKEVILQSAPITIEVKPLPAPAGQNYTGAVGRFALQAQLQHKELAAGRTGKLQVTVSGAGNFLQLPMPEIQWPAHIEGFEPRITEQLQKEVVPVAGKKQYEFNFTADSAGTYTIPPVALTYFDPQTKTYTTVATDSLHLTVLPQKRFQTFLDNNRSPRGGSAALWWLLAGGAVGALLLLFLFAKKRKQKKLEPLLNRPVAPPQPTYANRLKALSPTQKDLKAFYSELHQIVLQFLKQTYHIAPSGRVTVQQQLEGAPFSYSQKAVLAQVLQECEQVQYYNAVPSLPFTELQQKAVAVVSELERGNEQG